jgi:hypothetical protein
MKGRVLKPEEVTPDMLKECEGRIICERPYVKLLSAPTYYEDEVVPGMVNGEWRAVAQFEDTIAVVIVTLRQTDEK